ncbi:MAG: response regulator transcription factor [Armatimonadota bacterium]
MSRILVAEDEAGIRSLVSRGLAHDGYEVLMAADGRECLKAVHHHHPDLLILDIEMPGPDGLEICSRLRDQTMFRGLPIMFMTGRHVPSDIIGGFDSGGDDYVTKPFDLNVLRARVRALLRRSEETTQTGAAKADDGDMLRTGPFVLNPRERLLRVEDRRVELTPTELSLFSFLLDRAGEVFSSEELLQLVWEYPYGVGEKATVRVCVKNLRDKIEPDPSSPRWLVTRPRHGYTIRIDEAG